MRIEQVRALRDGFRNVVEPLPSERRSTNDLKYFHLVRRDSVKRLLVDTAAPWVLPRLQPWIRRQADVRFPVRYDLLSWGERWAMGAVHGRLLRAVRPRDLSAVLVQGCWLGDRCVQYWLRRGARSVHGVEIIDMRDCWEETVPRLQTAFGREVTFRHGSVEDVPYPDGMFDLVTSEAVYEHVYNLDLAAREAARVLRPGGRAVHSIGPLYYGYAGDHCISTYGFEAGYDHLLLDEPAYRQRVEDHAVFARSPSPQCHMWAVLNKLSFARLTDYFKAFAPYFDVEFLVLVISPEGVRYRAAFPDRWARLLASGITPADLLVTGMKVLLRRR
jgi:SAM-dependent methyltransferase